MKTDICPARYSHDVVKKTTKPQQEETLHPWQRDPISYIQSKLVTYCYNYTNVLIPFFGKNTNKKYNIYFIGSSQMELNVFSLCTYGQLATNLGKRDRTLNHPTNTETSLNHNWILNLNSRSCCGEEGEAALPVYCQDKNQHKGYYDGMLSVGGKKCLGLVNIIIHAKNEYVKIQINKKIIEGKNKWKKFNILCLAHFLEQSWCLFFCFIVYNGHTLCLINVIGPINVFGTLIFVNIFQCLWLPLWNEILHKH